MRILFVRANQGQPDSRVEKEIYSLSKEHTVELYGWDRTKEHKEIEDRKVTIGDKTFAYHLIGIIAPQGGGFKKIMIPMLKFWLSVNRFLKIHKSDYDAIHFCDFDTAALSFGLAKKLGFKIVYDVFDYYADSHPAPSPIRKTIRKRENYIINNSDAVILCSEKRVEQIAPAAPKKLIIIHNTPNNELPLKFIKLQENREKTKKVKLVYVGMLSDDRFLREIAGVIQKRNDIEWHIGGFGLLEKFFIQLSNKSNNIFFYGKLPYEQALSLEMQCDIMTAIYDPKIENHKYAAPNKFYEALMLGKPLIMMKNTGLDSYVSKYDLGYVIDYDSEGIIKGLNNALNSILDRRENYREIGKRERSIYNEEFSWIEMERRLLEVYTCLR
jgi:glycosyltransferase involved in cell wall biosynthesis